MEISEERKGSLERVETERWRDCVTTGGEIENVKYKRVIIYTQKQSKTKERILEEEDAERLRPKLRAAP